MKRYFTVVSMVCLFALTGIAGAAAQEAQKANPATDFEYDLDKSGDGIVIYKYKGTATEVVIPAVIEDIPVVEISCEFPKTIVSIVFPDSVTTIHGSYIYGCFPNCKLLTKVVLPKNLTDIPYRMFYGCTALKEITLPKEISTIGRGAFCKSGLEAIEIPDNIKKLGDWSMPVDYNDGIFADCQNLKTVTIGNGIKVIGDYTFSGCTNLTAVTIGNGTERIGLSAFSGCTNLATVTIGSGIKSIDDFAFGDCSSLTTVNIGVEHVEYVYSYSGNGGVFSGCSALSLKEKQKLRKTGYTDGF